jgi:hypothetical protein
MAKRACVVVDSLLVPSTPIEEVEGWRQPTRAAGPFVWKAARLLSVHLDRGAKLKQVNAFMSKEEPSISLEAYLVRLCDRMDLSEECVSVALLYVDSIVRGQRYCLSSLSVHRILLTASVLALIWLEDDLQCWSRVAHFGGIRIEELAVLVELFLAELAWSLYVQPEAVQEVRRFVHALSIPAALR